MASGTGTQALDIEEQDEDTQDTKDNESVSTADEIWGELIRTATTSAPSTPHDGEGNDTSKFLLQGGSDRRYVIGRDANADIPIKDPHVSSKHCVIFRDEITSTVFIEDHSLSGTFVNGERVPKNTRKALRNGDTVSLLRPQHHRHHPSTSTPNATEASPRSSPSPTAGSPASQANGHIYHEFVFRSLIKTGQKEQGPCKGAINKVYDVLDVLGSGSFATVRRGVNKHTGDSVAIKIVEKKNFTFEPDRWKDQMKEIEMLRRIDHNACVRMLETFSSDEALYIVMEFIQGGELFDRIAKKGALSEINTAVVCRRLLDAVVYLHGEGIVHRDLKPENILLLHRDASCLHIKVADFGVARLVGGGCKTLTGSVSYIAPEVLERRDTVKNLGTYDYSCDVWSVGVIAYVCLFARLPFKSSVDDDNVVADLKKASKDLCQFKGSEWKSISAPCKDFLKRVFTIDPAQRITARDALDHDWIKQAPQHAEGETCEPPPLTASQQSLLASMNSDSSSQSQSQAKDEDGADENGLRKKKKAGGSSAHPPVPLFSQPPQQ